MPRPRSLQDVAIQAQTAPFDALVREFLDEYYAAPAAERPAYVRDEPQRLSPVKDAYLAAIAEHLCLRDRRLAPDWSEAQDRFLRTPFFSGGLETLKPLLFVQSPLAFRRRLIFISADALSRPRDADAA